MKVFVTGHLGYIGSVLTGMLKEHGHTVVGIDTGYFKEGVLGGKLVPPDVEIQKDIRQIEADDFDGVDAIIHLAALSDDPMGQLNPGLTDDINHLASVRMAQKAKEAGVPRFIFSSSCSMYGAADSGMTLDEEAPFNPITAYAKSKVEAEAGIRTLASDDFTPVYLRNATAYGASPRIRLGTIVLNNLMGWAVTTGQIKIKSDGTPWRPLVHVADICNACIAVLNAPRDAVHNEAFNVGQDSENFQVKDIADVVGQTVPGAVVEYTGEAQGDKRSYRVSFKKISQQLPGFQPQWTMVKGAEDLYRFFTDSKLTAEMFQSRQFVRLQQIKYLMDQKQVDNNLYWLEK